MLSFHLWIKNHKSITDCGTYKKKKSIGKTKEIQKAILSSTCENFCFSTQVTKAQTVKVSNRKGGKYEKCLQLVWTRLRKDIVQVENLKLTIRTDKTLSSQELFQTVHGNDQQLDVCEKDFQENAFSMLFQLENWINLNLN